MSIDPSLPLYAGSQYHEGLIGAFADSAPDRWGRNLIEKAERAKAREEHRAAHRLDDVDFLLSVSDDTRQGALRYKISSGGVFVGPPSHVPQLISLPELLHSSDGLSSDTDSTVAVKQLLDTGTTGLGGARPKASVLLDDGSLAIAKFPHPGDQVDVMAWEATALDLLDAAKIRIPGHTLTRIGDRGVLLLRRFDRSADGQRIGYISAMTALGARDGDRRDYVEIAEVIRDISLSPKADHRELFDRVVANVALANTDDHLRNHGFLARRGSWVLSPTFDVNPNSELGRARATSIMGADTFPDEAEALLPLADECGLTLGLARDRILRITEALSEWKSVARMNGIHVREISEMAEVIDVRLEALRKVAHAGSH
jgi:serine/threonine-protein kinase HipA